MNQREEKIASRLIYDGKVVKLYVDKVKCPNGNTSVREIVRHNGGAAILAITKDNKILLEKQYRYAYDEVLYEIPAGKLEQGEDSKVAAIREFEEETGFLASDLELLNTLYPTCGYSSEIIYLYLAKDFKKTKTNFDDDEIIFLEEFSIDEVLEMIDSNIIKDAKTIAAVMCYLIRYKIR